MSDTIKNAAADGDDRGTTAASTLRLRCLETDELDEQQLEILLKGDWKARDEPVGDPWYRVIIRHPLLYRKWIGFGSVVLQKGDIPPRDRQLLVVRTAWRCQCPAIFGYHVHIAHEGLPTEEPIGITVEEIEQVVHGPDHPGWSEFDSALIRSVDELIDSFTISDATWATLATRFTERQLVELPFLVGHYQMLSYSQNSLGIGPSEGGGLEAR